MLFLNPEEWRREKAEHWDVFDPKAIRSLDHPGSSHGFCPVHATGDSIPFTEGCRLRGSIWVNRFNKHSAKWDTFFQKEVTDPREGGGGEWGAKSSDHG